ncbi:hypothetical protein Y1Q_0015045 [Alligator mississippiensis]|uniref:Uncharacterized protein n=1 Tax=Alligator mississippiensis TaxID=8496 RepID=A0A151MJV8_ALLMI|nr:hypothetical protein Y1Q_0015045 [Alligator mississippiensis]
MYVKTGSARPRCPSRNSPGPVTSTCVTPGGQKSPSARASSLLSDERSQKALDQRLEDSVLLISLPSKGMSSHLLASCFHFHVLIVLYH